MYKLVTSPRFASTWIQVNTAAHQAVVTALSGGKRAVSTQNGQVVLVLAPFINIVKLRPRALRRSRAEEGDDLAQ